MSEVKIGKIISVSSEDKKYPASNLLGAPGSGKWKSAIAGEKQLSVVLQFKNAAKISSLHVGNEGSAFVEVLVGKESAASDQEWKVLLVTSSLMTPAEARSNTNLHKVRLFSSDDLSNASRDDTWDKAKVVCIQPFNKSQPYGLSFISFLTDDETVKGDNTAPKSSSQKLGAFNLADTDTDSDDMSRRKTVGGSMFTERARLQADIPPATAAAAVRAAAREADIQVGVQRESKKDSGTSSTPGQTKNNTSTLKKTDTPKSGLKRTGSPTTTSPANKKVAKAEVKPSSNLTKPGDASTKSKTPATSTSRAARSSDAPTVSVPFKEIMKGVLFSLSGFKNPKRGDIRDKAIQMGAKYAPDWDTKCTHLVCAYTNTPKFSQVDGKGYIVSEDWVLDSHKRKKKLAWRDFRLGRAKSPQRAKDDDKNEKEEAEARNKAAATSTAAEDKYAGSTDVDSEEDDEKTNGKAAGARAGGAKAAGARATGGGATAYSATLRQTPEDDLLSSQQPDSDATEIDTDDEIAAHLAKAAGNTTTDTTKSERTEGKGKSPASGKRPIAKQSNNGSTATNPPSTIKRALPELPDFLLDKVFFLYGEVANRRSIFRYIHAYGGSMEDYMCDEVQYVITDDSWDDNFDSALNDNPNLIFVKSKWIVEIHTKQKYVPHQKYAIVPS